MLGFDFQKIAKNDRFAMDFEDLGVMGSGGFADVHRAKSRIDGKVYAVKIIKVKPSSNIDETEQHFYRALSEVKIHSQLNHPQILKYHGCWMELLPFSPLEKAQFAQEDAPESDFEMVVQDDSFGSDGFVFASEEDEKQQNCDSTKNGESRLVLQRIGDGSRLIDYKQIKIFMLTEPCQMNLQTFLYERSVGRLQGGWEQNYEMALQMTKGLSYLHSKRIIHRDIKLHNILLSEGNHCKLIDFGLARKAKFWKSSMEEGKGRRYLSADQAGEEDAEEWFSKSVGTRLFSSPEQATSEKYDYRTDIFSLAIVIVLLFCSFSTVHQQRDLLDMIRQRDLGSVEMPGKLKSVLYGCLGPECERPPLSELQSVLRELLRQSHGERVMPLSERQFGNKMEGGNRTILHDLKLN